MPAHVQGGQPAEHRQTGTAGELGVVRLVLGCAPHGKQFIADVVDQDALLLEHALGKFFHYAADPGNGLGWAEPFALAAETADVAEEKRHVGIAALKQIGIGRQLAGELRGEELLELHARRSAACSCSTRR